jgi:hypothetical protein
MTNAKVSMCNEAYKAGLVPYAGPQCFLQLKDPVRLKANSEFVSKKKKKTDKISAKGSKADGDVDELEDIAFQLQHCWLRCDKCGARRLVSSECMAALTTESYQKDWRTSKGKVMPGDCAAGRWRAWLGGARSRYSSWLSATHRGSCVDADEAAAAAGAVDGEELGRSRDESGDDVGVDNEGNGKLQGSNGLVEGDGSGGVDGSRFKGVSSADLAEAMRAVNTTRTITFHETVRALQLSISFIVYTDIIARFITTTTELFTIYRTRCCRRLISINTRTSVRRT